MNGRNGTFNIRLLETMDEVRVAATLLASNEPWITLGRTYEGCAKLITNTEKEAYGAFLEDRLVGMLLLDMKGAFKGYIQSICIESEHRGKGLGTQLIQFAEARIFREAPNVFLCVSDFNIHARRLYERLGYSVIGELLDYVMEGHSELLMRKSICPLVRFKPNA